MSEFELSTLAMLAILLVALAAYSYWQVYRAKRFYRLKEEVEMSHLNEHSFINESLKQRDGEKIADSNLKSSVERLINAPVIATESLSTEAMQQSSLEQNSTTVELDEEISSYIPTEMLIDQDDVALASLLPKEFVDEPADAQFFTRQDDAEHAALMVFEPLMRLATWLQKSRVKPIQGIDAVIDITLSQPKNKSDIDHSLVDLRLDTDLPLHIYGHRSGQSEVIWQPLESGALYSGLRLTLQLANINSYADSILTQDWFVLAQRLAKRLASSIHVSPDFDALISDALYLYQLGQLLATPLVIQLYKPVGLWAGYEVHQNMTQKGLLLNDKGQYVARSDNGALLYCVLNDINNPRAQDFLRDALPTMHANTLSFCLDLARVGPEHQPTARLWDDIAAIASLLQGEWCNANGADLDAVSLKIHSETQLNAYYRQLQELNLPAGSLMIRRLLRG